MESKVKVWKEDFAIIKSSKPYTNSFATINDQNEITVIIEKNKVNEKDIIKINDGWNILTFDMTLPFELVGFISKVSRALADIENSGNYATFSPEFSYGQFGKTGNTINQIVHNNIPIFVLSGYSIDHVLVKKIDLNKAIKSLEVLGFKVRW